MNRAAIISREPRLLIIDKRNDRVPLITIMANTSEDAALLQRQASVSGFTVST